MKAQLMECVKTVEASCEQFLSQHGKEEDKDKCAKGFAQVARALRSLMIELESEDPKRGVIAAPIYVREQECGDHTHPAAVVFFTSKGEFFYEDVTIMGHIQKMMGRPTRKVGLTDLLTMGLTPLELVDGIKKTMHDLVVGKTSTMPMAQA